MSTAEIVFERFFAVISVIEVKTPESKDDFGGRLEKQS
jgi:hypothetical protein